MATRNMAVSFNPSNDRLLGPKTFQDSKNVGKAYDDSYADNMYDAIDSNRETGEFGQNEQKPQNYKKSGTDRAANLLESIQGTNKSKRPQSSNLGRQMSMQVNNQKSDNSLFHSGVKDKNKAS